nr:hypothetical protein BaRGS_019074 [Batillaria attramentaria]
MHHQKDLVKRGVLWEDEEFPANSKSLYFSKVDNTVQWMRPKELCKVPRLIEDCVTCNDLDPGELGNNWLLTACAAIAKDKKALAKVVPDHKLQEWDDKNQYAGIFKFSFWRFGYWIDVVVDDRLPTKNGELICCHAKSRNEFCSPMWKGISVEDWEKMGVKFKQEGEFWELTEDVPIVSCPCIAPYRMVTTITVETCADLLLEDIDTTPDPFVIIKCEGEKVQSYHESQTHNPEFNFMATFYRKKPAVPIFIEVMHKKKFGSELISTGACDENGTETGERKELVLSAKDKTMNLAKTGKMIVFVRSSFDLAAL